MAGPVTLAYLNAHSAVVTLVVLKHVLLQHLHGRLRVSASGVADGTGECRDVLRWEGNAIKAEQ